MTPIPLVGCRPEPLGAYLKALGVMRLVSEQVDPSTRGWWQGDTFQLESTLHADELRTFLLKNYRPTPVLSPWNKDAGFKEGNSSATATLSALETDSDPRFGPYRTSIAAVRKVRDDPRWPALDKRQQVSLLRNNLPDEALDWLDAAIVLRTKKPAFPALLGAGGNFGRLELSPTFIARVRQVLATSPKESAASAAWLRASLYEEGSPALRADPIGQFAPGSAGGLRATGVGLAKPVSNPWDFVLIIEGSMLWSSGVARRLGSTESLASIPFTVAPSAAGQASLSARERPRAELWAPLWSHPMGLPELRRLFAEGRISWGNRQARSGSDAVRAIQTLGVDAGVDTFVRHVVADRMGQSPLAVAVGRFEVLNRPTVAVTATIDRWADEFIRAARGPRAPTSMGAAATALEHATFAARSGAPADLQQLLVAVADAEQVAGQTERRRAESEISPVPWVPARDWLTALDDGSPELRLAASLAVARDDGVTGTSVNAGVLRTLLRPMTPVGRRGDRFARVAWSHREAPVAGFGRRPLINVLGDALVARSEAQRSVTYDYEEIPGGGEPWFPAALNAKSGDAEALAADAVDLDRFGRLLRALLLLQPEPRFDGPPWRATEQTRSRPDPAWRLLAPFYSRHPLPMNQGNPSVRLRPRTSWARRLVAGDVEGVLADALLRWRLAERPTNYRRSSAATLARMANGPRLAAALLTCPPPGDLRRAAKAVT